MFKLPAHVHEEYNRLCEEEDGKKAVFANLNDGDLVVSAKFWMQHCEAPKRFPKDDPVYDSTFWHVILPELLRRLER